MSDPMFYVKSSDTEGNGNRWRVINTWNGGAGGIVVEFTSELGGAAGHNQCFKWIHDNKPFSFHEAVTHQGYKIEQVQP